MKHEKTFAAIEKLKDVELELHRLKNALELANKALAQPAQKPRLDQGPDYERGFVDGMLYQTQTSIDKAVNALAQPAQEPVAWGVFEGNLHDLFLTQAEAQEMAALKGSHAKVRPLYTTPPQRPWVGLTDEEIEAAWRAVETSDFYDCVVPLSRAVEAKLKEKNT